MLTVTGRATVRKKNTNRDILDSLDHRSEPKHRNATGEKKRNIIMLKAVAGNLNKNLLFVVFAETVTTYTQLYTRRIEIRFLHLIVPIPIYNIWEL